MPTKVAHPPCSKKLSAFSSFLHARSMLYCTLYSSRFVEDRTSFTIKSTINMIQVWLWRKIPWSYDQSCVWIFNLIWFKNITDSYRLSVCSESVISNGNLCVPYAYKLLMFGWQLHNDIVEYSVSGIIIIPVTTSKTPPEDKFPVFLALSSFVSLYLLCARKFRAKLGRGDKSWSEVWLYYII